MLERLRLARGLPAQEPVAPRGAPALLRATGLASVLLSGVRQVVCLRRDAALSGAAPADAVRSSGS
ncbi:hypothetical protein [Pedococcus sp. 5OH_020]|uniref:hypothetical protein n=1 Tax=Pedococcus sp. 5OH_020 TaxID=2989814 RepID=UPI0022E9FEE5|nr:hypothetical protein [Pedococcus sp. 5OH_020]